MSSSCKSFLMLILYWWNSLVTVFNSGEVVCLKPHGFFPFISFLSYFFIFRIFIIAIYEAVIVSCVLEFDLQWISLSDPLWLQDMEEVSVWMTFTCQTCRLWYTIQQIKSVDKRSVSEPTTFGLLIIFKHQVRKPYSEFSIYIHSDSATLPSSQTFE